MLTRFGWCTLIGALVWPLALAPNLLNRHVRVPSASHSIGSIVEFRRRRSSLRKDGQLEQQSVAIGKSWVPIDKCAGAEDSI